MVSMEQNREAVRPKRIRTCIACGRQQGKTDLLRIVRTVDGAAVFDGSGRLAGRGAYVCSMECLEKAHGTKRLDRALKMRVSDQDYERIAAEVQQMLARTQR